MLKSFLAALLLTAASTGVHAFAPCASGMSEISVESINGIFCVSGSTICAAQSNQGACPGVQEGLKYGSYCGVVASGVYGCKVLDSESVKTFQPWVDPNSTPVPTTATPTPVPTTTAPTQAPTTASPTPTPTPITAAPTTVTATPTPTPTTAAPTPVSSTSAKPANFKCDQGSPMSVEGVEGIFCVYGSPVCAGNINTGACPTVQDGLPYGSYCGIVSSGVYGCKVLDVNTVKLHPQAVTPAQLSPSPTTVPTTTTTNNSSTPSVPPATTAPATISSSADCPNGGSPMSIEGVQKIFCVSGVACAANIATGNCPGKQNGLPFGSYCDIVRTGVYGCRPYVAENTKSNVTIAPPRSCAGNPAGNTPVSIVGALRDFCAPEPVCSGNRYGNCPGIQDGLDQDSICSLISYSVHGCIFKP